MTLTLRLRRQFSRGMVCDRSRRTHASLSLVTPSACELPLARTLLFVDCRLRVVPPIATHKGFRFGAPRNRPRENWRETERERERERDAFISYLDCRAQLTLDNESNLATGPDSRTDRKAGAILGLRTSVLSFPRERRKYTTQGRKGR